MTNKKSFEEWAITDRDMWITFQHDGTAKYYAKSAWQAAIKTPVILPALIDTDGLSGTELDCAKFHNNAIAMCSIAIRKAGYSSECSPMFYPPNKEASDG
ncbi:TPA: hypothetical protein ACPZLH_000649 [Yersinia enterocolitica]